MPMGKMKNCILPIGYNIYVKKSERRGVDYLFVIEPIYFDI